MLNIVKILINSLVLVHIYQGGFFSKNIYRASSKLNKIKKIKLDFNFSQQFLIIMFFKYTSIFIQNFRLF